MIFFAINNDGFATHGKNSAPCERRYPGTPRTESLGIRSVGFADGSISSRDWCDLRMLQYALWVTTTIPTSKTAHFFRIRLRPDTSRDFVRNLSMTAFSKPRNRLCCPPTQMARASEGEADWISIARHQVLGWVFPDSKYATKRPNGIWQSGLIDQDHR